MFVYVQVPTAHRCRASQLRSGISRRVHSAIPPDLDCGDISYRNFTVLAPDPHRFDSDKDSIGCER